MHHLVVVETDAHWRALHTIRRAVLFDTGVMPFVYDEGRPEDRKDGNTPYLLQLDHMPIGVARLDVRDAIAVLRLVGISTERQGQGHGRVLSDLIDARAVAHGVTELRVNAYKDAIGYYEKMGWTRAIWDAEELSRLAPGNVQMIKRVRI